MILNNTFDSRVHGNLCKTMNIIHHIKPLKVHLKLFNNLYKKMHQRWKKKYIENINKM